MASTPTKSSLLLLLVLAGPARASVLSTVAGGGTAAPAPGGAPLDTWVDSYGLEVGPGRSLYVASYEMSGFVDAQGNPPPEGASPLRNDGFFRIGPRGTIDWAVGGLPSPADDLAVDLDGSVYFPPHGPDFTAVIRIDRDGTVETVAGGLPDGFNGDGLPPLETQLEGVEGLAVDADDNLFIAEMGRCIVRKLDRRAGTLRIVAGSAALGCGYNGLENVPATEVQLSSPRKIAVDAAGNLYYPDSGNGLLRKVDRNGILTNIAGTPQQPGYAGDGGPATQALLNARGVAVDRWANIYLVDRSNGLIRRIDRNGIIDTVAGHQVVGGSPTGEDHPTDARLGTFVSPTDVSVDEDGQLFVADYFDKRVRRVAFNPIVESASTRGSTTRRAVVRGRYFGSRMGSSVVTLAGRPLTVLHWSNEEIHVQVPRTARPGPVVVSAEGGPSNAVQLVLN